ncbi:MAG: SDR family NAD(P)-dependent oxidoreductase, partial [Rubrivivax sp.]|nr:SDR family NAD(P)-dependent oxidoreductase [Rubrivivax sp.]
RVAVSARSAVTLQAFAREHADSLALPLDATDRIAMRAAAERIGREWGGLDMAVYCAGYYKPMRATAFDLDEALRHEQVNYVGALVMLDAVLPVLLRQKSGHISLVSSVVGYRGLPRALAYGPTKAALINLAESLYFDLTDHGIGVSVVCPGYVDTPATEQNDYRMPALITADEAAAHMMSGWGRGEFQMHFPKRFTAWVKALSHVGDAMYFRAVRRVTGL